MLTVTLSNFDLSSLVFKEQSLARYDNISIQDHHTKLKKCWRRKTGVGMLLFDLVSLLQSNQ